MAKEQKRSEGALRSGLRAEDREIPLEGVTIEAQLIGFSTKVTVTQRYRNLETRAVEAVYVFPLDESAAVCGFEAWVGEKRIVGRVEDRDTAFEEYDDAMEAGHGAFLLDQERPNVFTASIGNLRPGETVDVEISYVSLARREGAAARLTIPTTVAPRYVPPGPQQIGQPEGERVNPDRRSKVPYGLTLGIDIFGAVALIDSPSHAIRTTLRGQGGSGENRDARVELSASDVALDRDFVLLVESVEPTRPSARMCTTGDGQRFCQVTFLPELKFEPSTGSEIIFVLDCSGSMQGDSIEQAKRALALCLRALDEGDTFNIIRFGSNFESMWSVPRAYATATLEEATSFVLQAGADLGGTEILAPLRSVLDLKVDSRRGRQVLLLTDGEVSNEVEVIELVERHLESARIFTFGIGAGASEYLVRGVARASRGAAEMIFPGERIEAKVLRMFARVRTPSLDDVVVEWGDLEVEQHPATPPPIFVDDSLTVFARVVGGESRQVHLRAGDQRWKLELEEPESEAWEAVPQLWAREAIRDIEVGVDRRRGSAQRRGKRESSRHDRLVELGRSFGLMSSATSYVAIEVRRDKEKRDEASVLRRIPIALTIGWGGYGSIRGVSGPMSCAPPSGMGFHAPLSMAVSPPRQPAGETKKGTFRSIGELAKESFEAVLVGARDTAPVHARSAPIESDQLGPEPSQRVDRLYELLMSQHADGSFGSSPALERWLGAVAADRVLRRAASCDPYVLTTAVVIALVERDEISREDEWQLAIQKARKWLEQHEPIPDVMALIAISADRSEQQGEPIGVR